jgi:phosphoglycolate phosphatase
LEEVKVIVYDCDGVLVQSRRANEAFYNHILGRFGMPPLEPEQLDFVQVSTSEGAIDHLFQDTPWLEAAQAYQRNIDNSPFIPLTRLEPHVVETLAALRPRYRTAVATNRGKSLPLLLRHHGLMQLFDLTVSCLDVPKAKPHPACLHKIIRHFRVAPVEVLYIGDAEVDRLVSARAGVQFVAYKNPELPACCHLGDHLDLLRLLSLALD